MSSLWPRLADLPLVIDGCEHDLLTPGPEYGEAAHSTRLVRLQGKGEEGLAEDITLFDSECPELPLSGEFTLGGFVTHLAGTEQWREEPEYGDMMRRWRNWAYESAALDLALRQAGEPLHAVLGLEPRPVTYVNSLGLGEEPSTDTILRRLEHYPGLRFKLDAHPAWTDEIVATLAGTGAVDIIDFKGQYGIEVSDVAALLRMYDRVLAAFPDALLEDTHDLPEVHERLEPHRDRLSWDAPIAKIADLDTTPLPATTFNIKPTRIGHLEELFAIYATCAERGYVIYGGGMGELGVARGQIQYMASLFSPDAPNDIAPSGFNAVDPAPGMPPSPLDPAPAATGFRRAG